ncbi:hypothetical protein HMPREF1979_01103 [Actinomyces johnsonii F0542]|uniref:Uncharacterized protein n=2 Tax=Actinomyces johnsonii TaxID=544581 RepID=U1QRP5_9ACTO|nr:hypothetical protein HMPREF1549_01536 [Actinomyces johnsonii F0510]ERH24681.1 hypothetical protein HMPREF1979_01103 [Actinomyces johnsonii F0542]
MPQVLPRTGHNPAIPSPEFVTKNDMNHQDFEQATLLCYASRDLT